MSGSRATLWARSPGPPESSSQNRNPNEMTRSAHTSPPAASSCVGSFVTGLPWIRSSVRRNVAHVEPRTRTAINVMRSPRTCLDRLSIRPGSATLMATSITPERRAAASADRACSRRAAGTAGPSPPARRRPPAIGSLPARRRVLLARSHTQPLQIESEPDGDRIRSAPLPTPDPVPRVGPAVPRRWQ